MTWAPHAPGLSVIWNKRQHRAQRRSISLSDEHDCYCATQWLPEKCVCHFVLSYYSVRSEKKKDGGFKHLDVIHQNRPRSRQSNMGNSDQLRWWNWMYSSLDCCCCTLNRLKTWHARELRLCTDSDWVAAEKEKEKHSVCVTTFIKKKKKEFHFIV